MLRSNAQTHGSWRDVLFGQFLRRELRVGGGVGMNHQALHIGHVGQQREDLQGIDELNLPLLETSVAVEPHIEPQGIQVVPLSNR